MKSEIPQPKQNESQPGIQINKVPQGQQPIDYLQRRYNGVQNGVQTENGRPQGFLRVTTIINGQPRSVDVPKSNKWKRVPF